MDRLDREERMKEAWARLTPCVPLLRAYVRRVAQNGELTEEVIQETCLRILRSREAPDDPSRYMAWCRGVARNVWLAELRKSLPSTSEIPLDSGLQETPDFAPNPEQRAAASEKLARASAEIDDDGVELLVRRYLFGERIVDLADEQELKPNTVRMRLLRLRGALRATKAR
jgi:RNA polymerase sigma factor (sigma-70 family)